MSGRARADLAALSGLRDPVILVGSHGAEFDTGFADPVTADKKALLEQGGHTRSYASLDTLVTDMTGTNIPIAALFDWLHGQPTPVQGWIPDLSRAREGRLSALRQQPLPTAHLHVILDQAQPTP